jgi:hypothetical protein
MSRLTDIRRALERVLEPIEADVRVAPAGGKQEDQSERFVVRILVGDASDDSEVRLDDLLGDESGSVRALLAEASETLDGTVGAHQVVSHTGWRLFPPKQRDGLPQLGTELTVATYLG